MDTETHDGFGDALQKVTPVFRNLSHYYYYENGFTPRECEYIIENFSNCCTQPATIFGGKTENDTRRTKLAWIPRNKTTEWIYDKMFYMAKDANTNMFNFDITSLCDLIQFACYDSEEKGNYQRHMDMGADDIYACRKLSITVQLSKPEDYDGGKLKINKYYSPQNQGASCVFPSYIEHEVEPVTRGKRHSLVLWFYGPQFR